MITEGQINMVASKLIDDWRASPGASTMDLVRRAIEAGARAAVPRQGFGLTAQQRDLLTYIQGYVRKRDYAPSFDEMKDALGLKSKSGIFRLVGEAPQWAQDRAKELLKTAPKDMLLWMVLAHGLAQEREACAAAIYDPDRTYGGSGIQWVAGYIKGRKDAADELRADWRREQQKDETR